MAVTEKDVHEVLSLAKRNGLYLVNLNQKHRTDEVRNNLINSMNEEGLFDSKERENIADFMLKYERTSDPAVESFFRNKF